MNLIRLGFLAMMTDAQQEKYSTDLLSLVKKELHDVGYRIVATSVNNSYHSYAATSAPSRYGMPTLEVSITVRANEDNIKYIEKFGYVKERYYTPILRDTISSHLSPALALEDQLTIHRYEEYDIEITHISLHQDYVQNWINAFREETQELRFKMFEKEFDSEVEEELSEYNGE